MEVPLIGTGGCRALTVMLLCLGVVACAGRRVGDVPPYLPRPAADPRPYDAATAPAVDYRARLVGGEREGGEVFANRVERLIASHPTLATARPGDGDTRLHLELTLTNRTNGWVAGLSGLACGLTFTLLPAYARDDFDLDVELRTEGRPLWHRQYHDAVATFVHFTLVFTPRAEQPRVVVEDVVDDLVRRALDDLDASGLLARAPAAP